MDKKTSIRKALPRSSPMTCGWDFLEPSIYSKVWILWVVATPVWDGAKFLAAPPSQSAVRQFGDNCTASMAESIIS